MDRWGSWIKRGCRAKSGEKHLTPRRADGSIAVAWLEEKCIVYHADGGAARRAVAISVV